MLRQHSRFVEAGLRLLDAACLSLAMPAALALRHAIRGAEPLPSAGVLATLIVLVLLAWSAATWSFRVYDTYRIRPLTTELGRITSAAPK
jgi:hypothetical protein